MSARRMAFMYLFVAGETDNKKLLRPSMRSDMADMTDMIAISDL